MSGMRQKPTFGPPPEDTGTLADRLATADLLSFSPVAFGVY